MYVSDALAFQIPALAVQWAEAVVKAMVLVAENRLASCQVVVSSAARFVHLMELLCPVLTLVMLPKLHRMSCHRDAG